MGRNEEGSNGIVDINISLADYRKGGREQAA